MNDDKNEYWGMGMNQRIYWLYAGIIMAAIFAASSIPDLHLYDSAKLPPEWLVWIGEHTIRVGRSGFFSYVVSPHPDYVLHKLGHIFAFGFLGLALYLATGRSLQGGVLIAAAFAASDELHQYFVAGRSSRLADILLDVLAAALFIWLFKGWWRFVRGGGANRGKGKN